MFDGNVFDCEPCDVVHQSDTPVFPNLQGDPTCATQGHSLVRFCLTHIGQGMLVPAFAALAISDIAVRGWSI